METDHVRKGEPGIERQMAERAQAGDTEAFGELLRRHRQRALGWAQAMAGNESMAEDIVQEAYLKAFLHVGKLMDPNRFAGWLKQIVRNEANMKLRRGGPYRNEKPLSFFADMTDADGSPAMNENMLERLTLRIQLEEDKARDGYEPLWHLIKKEAAQLIRSLLHCLNQRERSIFEAYFFMHYSAAEIARQYKTTSGSVHTYLNRAKKKIQEAARRERLDLQSAIACCKPRQCSLSMPTGIPDIRDTFIDRIGKLLRARGEEATATELMGRSGHAFRLKLSQHTTYAAGVFVFDWQQEMKALVRDFGYDPVFMTGQLEGTPVPLHAGAMLFPVVPMEIEPVAAFIRTFIDRGSPVLYFDTYVDRPFVHEWNLIFAYDDAEQTVQLTDVSPPYRKTLRYSELAASPLRFLCGLHKTTRPTKGWDPARSVKAALQHAQEGDGYRNKSVYMSFISGIRAYDMWIRHLEAGPRLANAYGHRYMAYAYSSARSFAGPYLRSLSVDRYAEGLLAEAALLYDQAAGKLQEISELSSLLLETPWTTDVLKMSIELLKKVKQCEEQAIAVLNETVHMMHMKNNQWEDVYE
ncbi:RNA polymerase sigma factor [Paenibacillus allorhizosphaerae]|uniref:Sigma-70 family RNA polymerase sigma factor n=1 Tax=Paenibacillus allorhizosphaerae TaxID=2849866 RepID=A0ABM8VFS2_9BACL|nr:sigma-70 family RNA polymerase sigma factor [Paenibacillus allorhizosphaerae]CAG7635784.1 hypothetical protein PAECIP111802_02179 [Paenibacillus allorhizosphaerae]